MEDHKIKGLLDKYWEGETTLEEERELKSYFASSQVADEFLPFSPLFAFYEEAQHVEMQREIKAPTPVSGGGKTVNLRWLINIAASIAIFIAMFYINKNSKSNMPEQYAYHDTYQSPEEAYDEVKKVLLFVSAKMNKGVNTAAKGLEKMEPLHEILN
ncbi:MAG: hypothetical protein HKN76_17145 [Saprospiraceae bacterium]|nr:hypothetical protein [Saprospiraceae bacterium]